MSQCTMYQYSIINLYKNTKKFNIWAYENELLKYYGKVCEWVLLKNVFLTEIPN